MEAELRSLPGDAVVGAVTESEICEEVAREAGWHAVLHLDTATSTREMERVIARER